MSAPHILHGDTQCPAVLPAMTNSFQAMPDSLLSIPSSACILKADFLCIPLLKPSTRAAPGSGTCALTLNRNGGKMTPADEACILINSQRAEVLGSVGLLQTV